MRLFTEPRRSRLRTWIFQVHLWLGLAIALVVSLVGLTGSILVFKPELEALMVSNLTRVTPGPRRVPIDQLVETLHRQRPSYRITNLYVYREPDLAWNFRTTAKDGTRVQVYFDPFTGRLLGEDSFGDHWLDWIYDLHEQLLLGRAGLTANAIFAWLLVLMCLTGIVVWWPGARHWRAGFRYHRPAGWKGQNYDLHKLSGFFSALLLALVAVTGGYYAFPDAYRKFVALSTASAALVPTPKSKPNQIRTATVEQIYQTALAAMPEAEPHIFFFPQRPEGIFSLRLRLPGDWVRTGNQHVYLDQYSGAVIRPDYYGRRPLGARIIGSNGPLHFGTFGGNVTRVLWVVLGFVPALLSVSGALMYWNRVWSKRRMRVTI